MALDRPVFTLDEPNRLYHVTNAEWWLWLRLRELEPTSKLGGIFADKPGFHNTGNNNERKWPGNYSIRDVPNRRGPWWREYASALDWTFPEAQNGDYRRIDRYTSRLMASAQDPNDPRLDLILFEFYGQADSDREVEGWNLLYNRPATSDSSHLWHVHKSFLRDRCGDFTTMWALLTVLMGWSVAQWQASLNEGGAVYGTVAKGTKGDAARWVQQRCREIDPKSLPQYGVDDDYGDETASEVKRLFGGDGSAYGPDQDKAHKAKFAEIEQAKTVAAVLEQIPSVQLPDTLTLDIPATTFNVPAATVTATVRTDS